MQLISRGRPGGSEKPAIHGFTFTAARLYHRGQETIHADREKMQHYAESRKVPAAVSLAVSTSRFEETQQNIEIVAFRSIYDVERSLDKTARVKARAFRVPVENAVDPHGRPDISKA